MKKTLLSIIAAGAMAFSGSTETQKSYESFKTYVQGQEIVASLPGKDRDQYLPPVKNNEETTQYNVAGGGWTGFQGQIPIRGGGNRVISDEKPTYEPSATSTSNYDLACGGDCGECTIPKDMRNCKMYDVKPIEVAVGGWGGFQGQIPIRTGGGRNC